MTIHLITGKAATPHITSTDIALVNQGLYGPGVIRLPLYTGTSEPVRWMSSNPEYDNISPPYWPEFTISDGKLDISGYLAIIAGRYVNVPDEETIQLPSAPAHNRLDHVVFTYHADSETGAESFTATIEQGEDTTAAIKEPWKGSASWANNGLVNTHVTDGAGYAVAMLYWHDSHATPDVYMAGTRHIMADISHFITWDWRGGQVHFESHGPVCCLRFQGVKNDGQPWSSISSGLYYIPPYARPLHYIQAPLTCNNGGSKTSYMRVNEDGTWTIGNAGNAGSGDNQYGSVTWIIR